VNIGKQTVTVFLDDDGQAILQAAAVPISLDSPGMLVDVIETDDLGIWIQIERGDGVHSVLIRWEYVLCLEIPERKQDSVGIGAR
jgi:hypothetical protein